MIKILSKEQLAYKLNVNPTLFKDKNEILKFWKWFEKVNNLRKKYVN